MKWISVSIGPKVSFFRIWLCTPHKCLCEKNRCFRHCLKYTIKTEDNQQKVTIFTYNILKKRGLYGKKSSCLEGYDFSTDRKLFFSSLFYSILEKQSNIVYNKLVREVDMKIF